MSFALTGLGIFAGFCLAAQWTGSGLAMSAMSRARPADARRDRPGISILRPVCGLENHLEATLSTTFDADYPAFEILFCVASPQDPVIPLVERLIAAHPRVEARLLTGDDRVSGNPKLNNLVKGWRAARHPMVLMADSNVYLPPDSLRRLMDEWTPGTGLVSSPPIGTQPEGFAARLECAFLNTLQARWQLASARLGNGFAQGKMLFWERKLIDDNGGLAMLGHEMAEDVASTKLVRANGLKVRLPARFFAQPIGRRTFQAVWSRQVRWARVRRLGFLVYFLPELLAGAALPALALLVLTLAGTAPLWTLPAFLILWYLAEYLPARLGDWPRSPADIAAWATRDLLLPPLWFAAWAGSGFEWRGNRMSAAEVPEPGPEPSLRKTPSPGA